MKYIYVSKAFNDKKTMTLRNMEYANKVSVRRLIFNKQRAMNLEIYKAKHKYFVKLLVDSDTLNPIERPTKVEIDAISTSTKRSVQE